MIQDMVSTCRVTEEATAIKARRDTMLQDSSSKGMFQRRVLMAQYAQGVC